MRLNYTDARKIARLRYAGRSSIRPEDWDVQKRDIPRHVVYNHLPSIFIDVNAKPTAETRQQSDALFVRFSDSLGPRKRREKQNYFQRVIHAAKQAAHIGGCVPYSRCTGSGKRIHIDVVEATIREGMFLEHRSPAGSPKMSRLLPLHDVEELISKDPWESDPNEMKQFVFLRQRKTDVELPVDWSLKIASETQAQLELINANNAHSTITYEPFDFWTDDFCSARQLRPVHFAVFTQRWDWNGRLHTARYGHQNLRKQERWTIQFDDEPSVELDFCAMHPRLLYHLEGFFFEDDPYALWGDWSSLPRKHAAPLRAMAKQLINTAINAKTRQSAISACNQAMNRRTADGEYKAGSALADAVRLYSASQSTKLTFADIYGLAERKLPRIAKYFGTDFGMSLMRIDSAIALDVLSYFAKRSCPCLSVHDSFIVPKSREQELRRVMRQFYYARTGFHPVVK